MDGLQQSRLITLFFGIGVIVAAVALYSVSIIETDAYLMSTFIIFLIVAVSYARNRPDKDTEKTIFQNLAEV